MRVRLIREAARRIALGLMRSGRASSNIQDVGNLLRLDRIAGGYYWIECSGDELRQGPTLLDAEPLQDSFRLAMARSGRGPQPAIPAPRRELNPRPRFSVRRDVVFER